MIMVQAVINIDLEGNALQELEQIEERVQEISDRNPVSVMQHSQVMFRAVEVEQ